MVLKCLLYFNALYHWYIAYLVSGSDSIISGLHSFGEKKSVYFGDGKVGSGVEVHMHSSSSIFLTDKLFCLPRSFACVRFDCPYFACRPTLSSIHHVRGHHHSDLIIVPERSALLHIK
jgi:hypothetical protein